MKTEQHVIKSKDKVAEECGKFGIKTPDVVMAFGAVDYFKDGSSMKSIRSAFPNAVLFGCSTAGEISNKGVADNTLVLTGVQFEKGTKTKTYKASIANLDASKATGVELAKQMDTAGLKGVMVLGRGLDINGSALIEGMRSVLGDKVTITGGLAGDGGAFKQTMTVLNDSVSDAQVTAVAFHGDNFQLSFGSMGGWEPFGPIRKVTKAKGSVMYEIDGEPALGIYKKYLGDKAKDLPASGLLFPFALLKDNQDNTGIIRTILAIDEAAGSLTFAGEIPEGGIVRLMHAKNEGLVGGAKGAASAAFTAAKAKNNGFGVLVSCVGRKLVMGDEIDDEIEAVKEIFGKSDVTGFYSYGEICPMQGFAECKLHNQTMTISFWNEV